MGDSSKLCQQLDITGTDSERSALSEPILNCQVWSHSLNVIYEERYVHVRFLHRIDLLHHDISRIRGFLHAPCKEILGKASLVQALVLSCLGNFFIFICLSPIEVLRYAPVNRIDWKQQP